MSSRQAQVENDCEEEEDYPQEEQMNAEVSTETSKHFEISTFAGFSSILVSEKKYNMFKYINQMLFAYQF